MTLGVYGDWCDGREYIGVEFPKEYVATYVGRCLERKIGLGSLIDFWEAGWPLLKGEPWR